MFGTSGIRGTFGETITSKLAIDVGRAVAAEGARRVVVGRDARVTGDILERSVVAGLLESGADVVAVGVASTPTVARAVSWYDADAGIVVTASHNPPSDNGLKLWNPNGMAFTESQRDSIERRILEDDFDLASYDAVGRVESVSDATDRHVDAIVESAGSLDSLDVVVDVGNGTGLITVDALEAAGASVTTLNAQPDGTFPGRPSEPNASTTGALQRLVASTDADFGVAHDGDADRMMAVDETGTFVDGDQLLAIFGAHAASPGEAIAAPLNTSLAVEDRLAKTDVSIVRTRVGDVYVAERAVESGVVFGGEPSGAWIWPSETLCPDGPYAAVMLATLVEESGPLSSLVAEVDRYPIRRESIPVDDKAAVIEAVSQQVRDDYDSVETMDGVRVETDDGWFLVRASGTEALVRVTAEARDADHSDALLSSAIEYVDAARTD